MTNVAGQTALPQSEDVSGFCRTPDHVMQLSRMGSAHPTRLSFLRILLRRMHNEGWQFDRPLWDLDAKGVGRAVYRAKGPERTYSLVAFAHDLPDHMRSDRVIATAWDATFALCDGEPTAADLDRLAANVPLQEAGRVSTSELCLSRANRSVRLFLHVVDRLAAGQQPDLTDLQSVGYLMRTTAVYGAGKFGSLDRDRMSDRAEMAEPFQAEMLSVWLIRAFTVDLVNHLAAAKGGDTAVTLDKGLRRHLGVGNATGLGMAPFLVRHPVLLNNWMAVREEALARVRALPQASADSVALFRKALAAAHRNAATWASEHPLQITKLADLRRDLAHIDDRTANWTDAGQPWNKLWLWASDTLSEEGQEALIALMLEPHGALVDGLACCLSAEEGTSFALDGAMTIDTLCGVLEQHYAWALSIDFALPESQSQFWYVSEEKLEPRIGTRFDEAGAEREQPLCIARMACELHAAIKDLPRQDSVAAFLLAAPAHRQMVRRAQIAARHPYAEVHGNLIAKDLLPIDLLRFKLAFFGASHFDPRSDKWVRISLFQGHPFPDEINSTSGSG